jgi:sigma-B regulation protein RsbU (phosphoserine phosphatase)
VARKIQEGLLPGTLPSARGLELAARIRFCLDVAGDYYDVVPLRDGRTLLAIGDVAGKGVGAALLMANLQASLRVVRNTGAALPDVMREINALVCENTPDDLFITLFVAVFDPATCGLDYVNAGHNPPVLVRADGSCERLGEGGLLLGVRPGACYGQASLRLKPGDLLLMFTDGVSEAMNGSGAEYGEERIERVACRAHRGAVPLGQVVDGLENDVVAFTGRDTFQDDFTLLLARVAPAPPAA